jgi:RimJ/RimL family protein N-acetyltransferase
MNDASKTTAAYRVETERLLLRCWSPSDAAAMREALDQSGAQLRPWIPFMKDEPRTLAQTAEWLRGVRASFDRDEAYHYAVFDKNDGTLLGGNMLNARVGPGGMELGYWTRTGFTGRGIAAEASCAMIRTAFEIHQAERAEIHCAPENKASAAIPKKLGFTHEATLAERVRDTEGDKCDLMIWTLFAVDYPGSPARSQRVSAYDCAGQALSLDTVPSDAGAGR